MTTPTSQAIQAICNAAVWITALLSLAYCGTH